MTTKVGVLFMGKPGPIAICRFLRLSVSLLLSILLLAALSCALLFAAIASSTTSPFNYTRLPRNNGRHDHVPCKHRRSLTAAYNNYPWPALVNYNHNPTITIFSAPVYPFDLLNTTHDPQYQALLSWLMLTPTPKIVLLGKDPSLIKVSQQFCDRVFVEPNIDSNFKGTPLFHSILARAQQADTDISVLINGDVLLLQDFIEALHKTHAKHQAWVLYGEPWELNGGGGEIPVSFDHTQEEGTIEMRSKLSSLLITQEEGTIEMRSKLSHAKEDWKEITKSMQSQGLLQASGVIDYWAWNNYIKDDTNHQNNELLHMPLLSSIVPPFCIDIRGTYEKWVVQHIIEESPRAVVEASEAVTSMRLGSNLYANSGSSWEAYINVHLSQYATSHMIANYCANTVAPWKLIQCDESKVQNVCMIKQQRSRNGCSNEGSSPAPRFIDDRSMMMQKQKPAGNGKIKDSIMREISTNEQLRDSIMREIGSTDDKQQQLKFHIPWKNVAPGLPHTLEELLPKVADDNRVVVMVGGTSNYKEMLLSFVCMVQSLGVKNVLVAAFDEVVMEYAYAQGLAVYLESSAEDYQSLIGSDGLCVFGSECFQHVSKLKSWSVLRVLRKGYTVLWSDIDIVWFENPLQELLALGENTLPIQSDEPDEHLPENSLRGANSGFYLARAEEPTIRAFEAIVGHALGTRTTEQPSFYDVLCGAKGERRVGDHECKLEDSGLRVLFLSHSRFPNGYVMGLWATPDPLQACKTQGCVLLHNNFIAGKNSKLERLVMTKGLWFFDVPLRMCIHPWHPLTRASLLDYRAHLFHALNLTLPPPPPSLA